MKVIDWKDEDGYWRRSIIRDIDDESKPEEGIAQDIPDIRSLDWDSMIRDLHNRLFEAGLFDHMDVVGQQHGISGAIQGIMRTPIVNLYRKTRT